MGASVKPVWRWLALGFSVAGLSGCASVRTFTEFVIPPPRVNTISIAAAQDMNAGAAVSVDVVNLYDGEAAQTVAAMGASEWFAGREDLIKRYGDRLAVFSWEVVPGQTLRATDLAKRRTGPVEVMVFALYQSPGKHSASARGWTSIEARLNRETLAVRGD